MKLMLDIDSANNTLAHLSIIGELDQTVLTGDYWPNVSEGDKQTLLAAKQVNVNLSAVERADTAGLAWLINLIKDAKAHKVKVSFQSVPDKLLNLADLSGAKEMLLQ